MKDELKEVILKNKNLIYSIASKFRGDREDLFQAGCLGLITAYKKYNSEFNTKFTTYAYPFILGEIYKYVLENQNIKISNELLKLNIAIKKAEDFLVQKLKRKPNEVELASFLEIPISKLREAKFNYQTISLDDDTNDLNLYNTVDLDNISKDDLILLKDALNKLNEKEKEIIIKRYFYNMTQSQIALELGVNQVKVSREEGKVLTKLRNFM